MRRKPDQGSSIHLSQGETAVPRLDDPTSAGLTPFPRQRCFDIQVFSSHFPFSRRRRPGRRFFYVKKNPLKFERVAKKSL
jgi:hypothetical protein